MVDENKLKTIRNRVERLRLRDVRRVVFGSPTHEYTLEPPLSDAEIARAELEHGITFPEDHRAFLTRVSSHGAGPYYGLLPLPPAPPPGEDSPLGRSFVDMGDRDQNSSLQCGLKIADHGCGYKSVLVLVGAHRGTVWADMRGSMEGFVLEATSFLDWYEQWLDRALAEWAAAELPEVLVDPGWESDRDLEAAAPILERRADVSAVDTHDRLYSEAWANRIAPLALFRAYQNRFDEALAQAEHIDRKGQLHLVRAFIFAAQNHQEERLGEAVAGLEDQGASAPTQSALLQEKVRALFRLGRSQEGFAALFERAERMCTLHAYYDVASVALAKDEVEMAVRALVAASRRGLGCNRESPEPERVLECAAELCEVLEAEGDGEKVAELRARLREVKP